MCFCFWQFDCPEVFLFVVILNNNHREFVKSFQKPKMFYNLRKTYNAQIPIIIQISGMQAYKAYKN